MTIVVALLLTAIATRVAAREFRAADTQNEDDPTVQAALNVLAMPSVAAALIERIRKVE